MSVLNDAIIQWMQNAITNKYLATILLSMVPMIEVRGAITVGTGLGMNPWIAFVVSCCSALVVCPILLLVLKPILKFLKKLKWFNRLAHTVEDGFRVKADKLTDNVQEKENIDLTLSQTENNKKSVFNKCLGIFLFVAIPLPLTGVWTGTAVAVFLDLKYKYSFLAITIGNFFAGLIITVLNIILAEYATIILAVLAVFMLISITYLIISVIVKSKKINNTPPNNSQ